MSVAKKKKAKATTPSKRTKFVKDPKVTKNQRMLTSDEKGKVKGLLLELADANNKAKRAHSEFMYEVNDLLLKHKCPGWALCPDCGFITKPGDTKNSKCLCEEEE